MIEPGNQEQKLDKHFPQKADLNRLLDLSRVIGRVANHEEVVFRIDQQEQRKKYEEALEFFAFLDGRIGRD